MSEEFFKRVDKHNISETPSVALCEISYNGEKTEDLRPVEEDIFDQLYDSMVTSLIGKLLEKSNKQFTTQSPITSLYDVNSFLNKPLCNYETFHALRETVYNTTNEILEYSDINIIHKGKIPTDSIIEHFGIDLYMGDVDYHTRENIDTPYLTMYGRMEYSFKINGTPNLIHIVRNGSEEYLQYKLEKRKETIKKILNK